MMKRSEINQAWKDAKSAFERTGWALPPAPRIDVTDMGLGEFHKQGLVLVNLAEEAEYCEKLMYGQCGQKTPMHTHKVKKEDIICRNGRLAVELWQTHPNECEPGDEFEIQRDGVMVKTRNGEVIILKAGQRVTLTPGIYHAFWPESEECVIGEISTANDDRNDNFFVDENVGRFPEIEEDEPAEVTLVSEQ